MIKLKHLLFEAGQQSAGKLELVSTSIEKAYKYASDLFGQNNINIDKALPNFKKNYAVAQKKATTGKTQRKDMPVIDSSDVKALQTRLSNGYIDIAAPHAPAIKNNDPFPQGLTGAAAERWLRNGLKQNDGAKSNKDDVVKVNRGTIAVNKLKPIQKQIYFDKAVNSIAKFGSKASASHLGKLIFITSADNYIIDGHHRFLSAMLIDPTMTVSVLSIDLPLSKLLPFALAYGDAIGNKRNA